LESFLQITIDSDGDTAYFNMRFRKNGVTVYAGTELRRLDGKTAVMQKGNGRPRWRLRPSFLPWALCQTMNCMASLPPPD
jgi:hypothetical protein